MYYCSLLFLTKIRNLYLIIWVKISWRFSDGNYYISLFLPKKLLLKWKIMKNSLCNICNMVEDYSHYFRTCIFFKDFWGKIKEVVKKKWNRKWYNFIYHLVFGYKIFDKSYYDFNYFLTIIGFSIYKAYYISEQKTKRLDVYSLFVREYLQIYRGNEIIQKSSLLKRLQNYL